MSSKAAFVYSPDLLKYRFHDNHPFNPLRLRITVELLREAGILEDKDIVAPRLASEEELKLIHSPDYLEAVSRAGNGTSDSEDLLKYELGTEDVPVFEGMHWASSLTVGGTLTAVEMVMEDKVKHAVNIAGGLHHAQEAKASGFCVYNDAAIAIAWIKKKYGARVLYIDTDAHHGDGVQNAFYDDPDVMVISIHESGHYLFPGTGNIYEQGSGDGFGATVNIPMEPFTEDASWISAFKSVVIPHARMFVPDIIISQHGCDGHFLDPLTHLALTMRSFEEIPAVILDLAEQLCQGRLVALGGGGYSFWQVVPRAWSLLWSTVSGRSVGDHLPDSWIKMAEQQSGESVFRTFSDPEDLVTNVARSEEIKEKNDLTVSRIMRQSVSWL